MSTELRRQMVTARKQHQCSLCLTYIRAGEAYERATLIYDNQIGDFLTCKTCIDDRILGRVFNYWGRDECVNDEDAYDWAIDRTLYPEGISAYEFDAAIRFIDRRLDAIQPVRNPSKFEGSA